MGFKTITVTLALALFTIGCSPAGETTLPYQNVKLPLEKRLTDLFGRLSSQEKEALLRSQAVWRLGIPALKPLDLTQDRQVPSAAAMAATWDPDLVGREARVVAAEAIAANRRQVIGPDVRDFGDAPWLASRMAVAWVSGLQGDGVIATLSGFGAGDENSLLPYEAAIEEAGLWAIQPATADPHLIRDVLENDWGFKGFLVGAGQQGDDDVRRRLRAMFAIGIFDPETPPPPPPDQNFDESIVLLKNEHDLLPLASTVRSIAVIGAQSLAIPPDSHAQVGYASAIDAEALARKSEVALVFGNDAALIKSVAAANPRTIVVLDRPAPIQNVPAILLAWGRRDIGPVIFGKINPSGKLPITIAPQFAFGTGLSYTTFHYSALKVFPKSPRYGQLVQVAVDVTNTGRRAGAEVVQVYTGAPQELAAFRRVDLSPAETRTVSFELDRRATSFYDPLIKTWGTRPGVYEVTVGPLHDTFELFR